MTRASGSEFSAVARVLFENATKSGIVTGDSRRQFAKQLQRLATQSKRQGGSLGDVSMRMSEFVSAELQTATRLPATAAVPKGSIPALNIPSMRRRDISGDKPHQSSAPPTLSSDTDASPGLNLQIHGLRKKALFTLPSTAAAPPIRAAPLDPNATGKTTPKTPAPSTLAFDEPLPPLQSTDLHDIPTARKSSRTFVAIDADVDVVAPVASPTTSSSLREFEDTSLYSTSPLNSAPAVPKVVVREAQLPSAVPPPAKKPARQRIVVSAPDVETATPVPSTSAPTMSSSSVFSTSIDEWEAQREQEIQQLQATQREHEEKLAAAAEQERHRALGEEWAHQRHLTHAKSLSSDPFLPFNEAIYFANSWKECDDAFDAATDLAVRSSLSFPDYTISSAIKCMSRSVPAPQRAAMIDSLRERVSRVPNSAACLELIAKLSASAQDKAEAATTTSKPARIGGGALAAPSPGKRVMEIVNDGGRWEQVLSLYSEVVNDMDRSSSPSQRTALERTVAVALRRVRNQMDRDTRVLVTLGLVEAARKKTTVLDKITSECLARLVGGRQALQVLGPLDAPDADESTLALHISFTHQNELAGLLASAVTLGFNLRDPNVVKALAMREFYSDPMKPFAMIAEQKSDGITLNQSHFDLALFAAQRSASKEVIVAALAVVNDPDFGNPTFRRAASVSKVLFPALYEVNMLDEVYELFKKFESVVDYPKVMPTVTLIVNSALKHRGLPPLNNEGDASKLTPRILPGSTQRASSGANASSDDQPSLTPAASQHSLDSIISTDTMLEYAKDRNWAGALALLQRLPKRVPTSQEASAVLLYNCALNAATDEPELVERLLAEMQSRGDIRANSTTYNTAMSAFARSDSQWQKALDVFQGMEPQLRDTSTYQLLLSLYGKQGLWEEALGAWVEVKAAPVKPTPRLFSLGIQSLHKHSWNHTLAIFQEMLKAHGVANIKEVDTLRVMKSLEDNKKFAEAQKVENQLEKLRSKGKGSKKK